MCWWLLLTSNYLNETKLDVNFSNGSALRGFPGVMVPARPVTGELGNY